MCIRDRCFIFPCDEILQVQKPFPHRIQIFLDIRHDARAQLGDAFLELIRDDVQILLHFQMIQIDAFVARLRITKTDLIDRLWQHAARLLIQIRQGMQLIAQLTHIPGNLFLLLMRLIELRGKHPLLKQ